MALFSADDIAQEERIKRFELGRNGIKGYLADIEVSKMVSAIHRRNQRDRLIPSEHVPDVPITIEINPAITLGMSEFEYLVCSEVADVGISRVTIVNRTTAQRVLMRVGARLMMSGIVQSSANGSMSGSSGEESGGLPGCDDMNVDL